MTLKKLKLGFFSGRLCSLVGDEVRTDAGMGRLIDALGAEFETVNVALCASPTPFDIHDHTLSISRQHLLPLPFMPSYARAVPHFRACRRVITELEAKSDVLVVQLPFQVPAALLFGRRPRVYHLCADVRRLRIPRRSIEACAELLPGPWAPSYTRFRVGSSTAKTSVS